MLQREYIWLGILLIAVFGLLLLLLFRVCLRLNRIEQELSRIDSKIKYCSGKEKKAWKRRKRRHLWRMVFANKYR